MDRRHELNFLIEGDDPSLKRLTINHFGGDFVRLKYRLNVNVPRDHDWEGLGVAIGRNTHLTGVDLHLRHDDIAEDDLEKLLRGVSRNQSLQALTLYECDPFDGKMYDVRVPTLEEISLQYMDDVGGQAVSQMLARHANLRKLRLEEIRVGTSEWNHLATFLKESKLVELAILRTLGDTSAAILAEGISGASSLKTLNLCSNDNVGVSGWGAIFSALQSPISGIQKLDLGYNWFDVDGVLSLLVATLANNPQLRTLNLEHNDGDGVSWDILADFLSSPNCMLEELVAEGTELRLEENAPHPLTSLTFDGHVIGNGTKLTKLDLHLSSDEEAVSLAAGLRVATELEGLDLSGCGSVDEVGWRAIFSALQGGKLRTLQLKEYSYVDNNRGISDDVLPPLVAFLVSNPQLRTLHLGYHSIASWDVLVDFLRSPDCMLEELDCGLGHHLIRSVLCDTTSAMHTQHSNHCLGRICAEHREEELPWDINFYLHVNRENTRGEAARRKVLFCHWNELVWLWHQLKMAPYILAWMGRDGKSNEVRAYLYANIIEDGYGVVRREGTTIGAQAQGQKSEHHLLSVTKVHRFLLCAKAKVAARIQRRR